MPDFTCDSWCYEAGVDFLDARSLEEGKVEMRHQPRNQSGVLVIMTITPEPGAVETMSEDTMTKQCWFNTPFARLTISSAFLAALFAPQHEGLAQENGKGTVSRDLNATQFSEHLIADKYAYAYGIAAADLDCDGDLDLTSADYTPHNRLYLFENNSHGDFERHLIQKNDPERLERHMIGDVDRDGDLDVVIVKNLRGQLLWFENNGKPTNGTLWQRHVITTKLPGAYDVALADFNRDGHLDVAASSWVLGNQFAWFENDGTPTDGPWKKHLIEKEAPETRTMRAADFDGDGDTDLLGTVRRAAAVVWYENYGPIGTVAWQKHFIDDKSICPAHGNPKDMDGDGDLDVVMALGFYYQPNSDDPHASRRREDNQIVWYENDGTPAVGLWTKHIIQTRFDDAFEATAGDLDGDGDIDVAATSWRNPGRVSWFENHGDAAGKWTQHLLKDNWRSANQIIIADLNGDGRLDIAACAEHGSYEFRWWRNEGRQRMQRTDNRMQHPMTSP